MRKIIYPVLLALTLANSAFSQSYTIQNFAGGGSPLGIGDNGPAISAVLSHPTSAAIGPAGGVYIVDSGHSLVRKVVNGVITTVAGNGIPGYGGDNGPATSVRLCGPTSVAPDTAGNLYIADAANMRVRIVSGGAITTVAGNGTAVESGDNGPATSPGRHHAGCRGEPLHRGAGGLAE